MKLAALFSGGKDSVFATYIAMQSGHEIRYLVTVKPTDKASWIFHTPNIDFVSLMSKATGIPLITAGSDGTEDGDMDALKEGLTGLDIDGVVTGALWSDYQWDRINKVCGDLDLVTLSPLWRKSQDMLYNEMIAAGVDAIIVGVFAEGLNERWLGRHLDAECKEELVALRKKYGISIMGEGGEFESMTLDSPIFAKKIKILFSVKDCNRSTGTLDVLDAILVDKT